MVMTVVHGALPSEAASRMAHLACALGIETRFESLHHGRSAVRDQSSRDVCLLDVASFGEGAGHGIPDPAAVVQRLVGAGTLLVLSTSTGRVNDAIVRSLTSGAILGTRRADGADNVAFPVSGLRLSRELGGTSHPRRAGEALGLMLSRLDAATPAVSVGPVTTFARVESHGRQVFVWSTPTVFDMTKRITAELEFEEALDQFIPGIMFLRAAFGEACWTNPDAFAGVVIDDPLLEPRYGMLDFPALLESARRHAYHVTLGYIPWNHWRVRRSLARQFADHAGHFSICVHGCDHTRHEFGSDDYQDLLDRSLEASRRIDGLRRRFGLECVPLMVCPQERFSLQGLAALSRSRRYLGVLNSGCIPANVPESDGITGADLLFPGQDRYFGLPIFKRYYAKDSRGFALALFLGKPAILSEHHEFFEQGSAGVERFVQEVRDLRPDVRFCSMETMARRIFSRRLVGSGHYEVRFFSDTFVLERPEQGVRFDLVRRLDAGVDSAPVTIDGRDVAHKVENGWLRFSAPGDVTGATTLHVVQPSAEIPRRRWRGLGYHASVGARRWLSEFRDNRLAGKEKALASANRVMKYLKQTSLGVLIPVLLDLAVIDTV
jgi:hypothetical protein